MPSAARLARGDVIRFDVGGRSQNYRADIARVASRGAPDFEAISNSRNK
jgi:Xaa-Pro dipeptidase